MFFQRTELNDLVERVARSPVERNATRKLSFLLLDPVIPGVLSDIVVLRPELGSPEHCFPKHLAFGVVDNGLEYRLDAERVELLKKLFRQLESIAFYYPDAPGPKELAAQVSLRFWQLYRGYLSLEHLLAGRELSNHPELAALVEGFYYHSVNNPDLLGDAYAAPRAPLVARREGPPTLPNSKHDRRRSQERALARKYDRLRRG